MPGAGGPSPAPTLAEARTIRALTVTLAEAPRSKRSSVDGDAAGRCAVCWVEGAAAIISAAVREMSMAIAAT